MRQVLEMMCVIYVPSVMASASFALFPANTPLSMSRTFCGTEPPLPLAVEQSYLGYFISYVYRYPIDNSHTLLKVTSWIIRLSGGREGWRGGGRYVEGL